MLQICLLQIASDVMNDTTIFNIFNSNNIAYINTQNRQIMPTIAYRILTFESIIIKGIVTNHAFFAVVTFSKISSFTYIYLNTAFITSNLQKDFHQYNLSFNIIGCNICFCTQVKNQ